MPKGILKQSISCDNVVPASPPLQLSDTSSLLSSSKRNVSFKDDEDLVQKLIIPGRKLTRSLTLPPSSEPGYIFSPTRKARFFVGCDIGEETETSSSSSSSSGDDTDDEEAGILSHKPKKFDKSSQTSFYNSKLQRSRRRRKRVIYKIFGITIFLLLTFSLFFFKPGFEGKQARTHHHRNRVPPPQQAQQQHNIEILVNETVFSND